MENDTIIAVVAVDDLAVPVNIGAVLYPKKIEHTSRLDMYNIVCAISLYFWNKPFDALGTYIVIFLLLGFVNILSHFR